VTTDPSSNSPARARRSGVVATLAAVIVCLVVASVLFVLAVRSGDDEPSDGAQSAQSTAEGGEHQDHDLGDELGAVLAGCDAEQLHNTMMMFDPFVADQLAESGCTWPYDAGIDTAGGVEDPSINAAFEARRYSEVFDLIAAEGFGMCSVANLAPVAGIDTPETGFVFGFSVAMQADGCVDGVPTVTVDIREYSTRPWRDSAANHTGSSTQPAVVLGRWVITIGGPDTTAAARFRRALIGLGGDGRENG
jgi:hypothetical protein